MNDEEKAIAIEKQEKELAQMRDLTKKIKHCLEIGTMSFFLEDGKLVALGHFGAGDDTVGHDEFSAISWETFLEQDFS